MQAARNIANYYRVELIELNLSKIFAYSNSSLLEHSGKEIPHCSYVEQLAERKEKTLSTYIPFRNGLFCPLQQVSPFRKTVASFSMELTVMMPPEMPTRIAALPFMKP